MTLTGTLRGSLFLTLMLFAGCRDDSDPLPPAQAGVEPAPAPEPAPVPPPEIEPPESEPPLEITFVVRQSGTFSSITSVEMIDANRAIAAAGDLLITTDAGASFTSPTGGGFAQVDFVDAQNGFAITGQQVLATTDGGITWNVLRTALFDPFTSLSFINAATGFVTTQNGELLRTLDGGRTFTTVALTGPNSAPLENVKSIAFANGATGFLIADDAESGGTAIFKTADGGITWAVIFSTGGILLDLAVIDAERIRAVGSPTLFGGGEFIVATDDGGETFAVQHEGGTAGLIAVDFVNSEIGFAVGLRILRTVDGGLTWTPLAAPISGSFLDVDFVSPSVGIVVGSQGVILTTATAGQ